MFQLGTKNVTILHTFAALFQYDLFTGEKNGTGRPRAGRGTWDNEAKMRDVPGNTGRLATLATPSRILVILFYFILFYFILFYSK